jgi:RNA polymerase sigma-70 factor (ECF subfamily)
LEIIKDESNLLFYFPVSSTNLLHLISADELTLYIRGCTLNQRESQKKIYYSFYGYAMSVCERYTGNQEDALEILNDGYLKIFKEIHRFKPSYSDTVASFKGWLKKIMVCTAIDHFRKQRKHEKGKYDGYFRDTVSR